MTWRNFENHKDETKAVKQVLRKAGIAAKVGHWRGTAWGWLEINLGPRQGKHMKAGDNGNVLYLTQEEAGKLPRYYPCLADCPVCEKARALRNQVVSIVLAVTNRRAEDPQVIILEQE